MTENIFFSLEEEEERDDVECSFDVNKLLNDLEQEQESESFSLNNNNNNNNNNLIYFIELSCYFGEMGLYYNEKYTVKELMKICNYYGIDKNLKACKCKKQDIIESILYFESCKENNELVNRRHNMWAYLRELLNDSKMKKYLIY
jgi:hypothetical protein